MSVGTTLYTFSTATDQVINTLAFKGCEPATSGIAVTADGTRLFADDGGDNKIFEIDLLENRVIATIRVGDVPGILATTPDSKELWVGDDNSTFASVIDIPSGKLNESIPLGSQPYGIVFGPQ